jgi:predicted DsbA family dithiol-disulfide isomerase
MTLDFFFDPGCPWTWRTSRWVTEVAPHREVAVRWRAYSLDMKNEKSPTTAQGALRIVEAVWVDHGDEPIGRLYTEVGTRFHPAGHHAGRSRRRSGGSRAGRRLPDRRP